MVTPLPTAAPSAALSAPKANRDFKGFAKFILIAFLILTAAFVIFMKVQNPEFSNGAFVFLLVVLILGAGGAMFGPRILASFRSAPKKAVDELPPPVSDEECYQIVRKEIQSPKYANFIGEIEDEGSEAIGDMIKSEVYTMVFKGYYLGKDLKDTKYAFVINKHFPHTKSKVLINPTEDKISKAKNLVASYPSRELPAKTIVRENTILGTRETITEPTLAPEQPAPKEELT